jgi:hypothetical protein
MSEPSKSVREITAKLDAMASRSTLSIAEIEVVAVELGVAVAERCAHDIVADGVDLDEAAARAAWAVEEPFKLVLAEFPGGPAEAARRRLEKAAVNAFKVRIAELHRN